MGCDYFADENGEFEMEFRDHDTGAVIAKVVIPNLKPGHEISKELLKGRSR